MKLKPPYKAYYMSRLSIFISIFGLTIYWSIKISLIVLLVLSGIFAILNFNPLVAIWFFIMTVMFFFINACVIGGINGTLWGLITIGFFYETHQDKQHYQFILTILGIIPTIIIGYLMIDATLRKYSVTGEVSAPFVVFLVLCNVGGVIAVGHQITKWYLRKEKSKPQFA